MDFIKIFDEISQKLNSKFVSKKLDLLDKSPVIIKNISKGEIDFVGNILSSFSKKSFDIYFCNSEQEFREFLARYKESKLRTFTISKSSVFNIEDISSFERVSRVWEKGEYSVLGDVIILWLFNFKKPVRISLFDNVVESIDIIEETSFRSLKSIDKVDVYLDNYGEVFTFNVSNYRYKYPLILINESLLDINFGLDALDLGFRSIPGLDYYVNNKDVVLKIIDEYINQGFDIICSTKNIKELEKVLGKRECKITEYIFSRGLLNSELKVLILSEYELFGQITLKGDADLLKKILPGDFLVHEDHGIGIFEGVVEKLGESYIDIRYSGKDKLLVPLSQSDKVSKYLGGKGKIPVLTSLNSGVWQRTKKKVKFEAESLAKELLQLYAMRKVFKYKEEFSRDDLRESLDLFIKDFEFKDTLDQKLITEELFNDILSGSLMDRLLVGDVGFGKTELAMRAAYLVLSMAMQVAILAPTTILVSQHSSVFVKRFAKHGFKIGILSRLSSNKEKQGILEDLESGNLDLVIGTHALLNDRVKFKNLGLIIIDEEQKFGVKQKEKLKQKRIESHVLSMSATPIPRSMSMSLSGIRDISMLFTPPEGRKAILNRFEPFDWDLVKKAIEYEVSRGGQVYFLHNRVMDIGFVKKKLVSIFPSLNIAVLHGQLSSKYIAKIMDAFCSGEVDVLICTTIIENGIDLPNVNTLIVDDSSRFGLSQLYQIRGRIGRSKIQSYAYFFYKSINGQTSLRLDALMEAKDLGSGFLLANRDLEIRGAGELLGSAQSGSINSVGYSLFMKFLTEAVAKLK